MNLNKLVNRIDELILMGQNVLSTKKSQVGWGEYVNEGKFRAFRTAILSFISQIYPETHPHHSELKVSLTDANPYDTKAGIETLKVIKGEIEGGWLFSLKGLVTAEIFSDFLEMADHLLSNDYKDAAAVIIGSVLEENLRQLCIKNKIDIEIEAKGKFKPKKADLLNADLSKNEICSKLDQKSVTAWLDLRNKAAHGQYDEYNKDQVVFMLQGVTEFLARVSI
jgi:hypothetical protein